MGEEQHDGDEGLAGGGRGEVVPHHVPPSGAGEVCGVDVLAAADSEDFGAGDAGHLRPVRQRDGRDDRRKAAPEQRHDDDAQQQVGERVDAVDRPHHDPIGPAAESCGSHTDPDAQHSGGGRAHRGDEQ